MIWLLIFGMPSLIGAACALIFKKHQALVLSALIPWSVFLVFNLYSEYYSPDREIMQGSWVFFQTTLGSITAIFGLLGAFCVIKFRARVLTHHSSGTPNSAP